MVKAHELRIPFTWQERHVVIKDRVWFLPPRVCNDPFVFEGWDHPELFGASRPIRIEYCSGNGSWIIDQAKKDPHSNWLAVEKQFYRARLIWAKIKNLGLDNLAVALAEGLELTERYIPSSSVEEIFVNFPDPWPKRRHGKHRIIKEEFVNQLARIIKPKGTATLVTDDEDYSKIMIQEMQNTPDFISQIAAPYYIETPANYGTSFFDSLFRGQEKVIRLHKFERV